MREEQNWSSYRLMAILSLGSLEAEKMCELALKTKDVIKLTFGEPDFMAPSACENWKR